MTFEEWQAGESWTTFANKIKQYRAKKMLTQREFAKVCKVSYSTVQAIESKTRITTYATVYKITKIMEEQL